MAIKRVRIKYAREWDHDLRRYRVSASRTISLEESRFAEVQAEVRRLAKEGVEFEDALARALGGGDAPAPARRKRSEARVVETRAPEVEVVGETRDLGAPELKAWRFGDREVRIAVVDGEPWFVAKDVCDALGIANSRDAVGRLDDDEKGVALSDTLGGPQELSVISEPGLYSLVVRSDKLEARTFRRWVTHEVLPEIRKTGRYEGPRPGLVKIDPLVAQAEALVAQARGIAEARAKAEAADEKAEQALARVTGVERRLGDREEPRREQWAAWGLPQPSADLTPETVREAFNAFVRVVHVGDYHRRYDIVYAAWATWRRARGLPEINCKAERQLRDGSRGSPRLEATLDVIVRRGLLFELYEACYDMFIGGYL